MYRLIGICGNCGGNVYQTRNSQLGVCKDCGAKEKQEPPRINPPTLQMEEIPTEKKLLLS